MSPDQNVYVFVRLNEKSNTRRRPAAPAMCSASLGDTGILMSSVIDDRERSRRRSRTICFTSTHVTACTPPTIVYSTAGTPITATDQLDRPAEDRREHHRRRGDDRPARHAARQQKQKRRERSRLRVEAALEILVRGVHLRAVEKRHERDAEDHHRQRQPEVELHEPHSVGGALPRRADHRHGGELRRHDGQSDGPPRQAAIGEEVSLDLLRAARPSQPVDHDVREPPDDDHPIQPMHAGWGTGMGDGDVVCGAQAEYLCWRSQRDERDQLHGPHANEVIRNRETPRHCSVIGAPMRAAHRARRASRRSRARATLSRAGASAPHPSRSMNQAYAVSQTKPMAM